MSENLGLGQTSGALFIYALQPAHNIYLNFSWVEAFIISKVAVDGGQISGDSRLHFLQYEFRGSLIKTVSWTKKVRIFQPENKVKGDTWFKQFRVIKLKNLDLNISNRLSSALWRVRNIWILVIYSIKSVKMQERYPLDIRMYVSKGQLWVRPIARSKRLW